MTPRLQGSVNGCAMIELKFRGYLPAAGPHAAVLIGRSPLCGWAGLPTNGLTWGGDRGIRRSRARLRQALSIYHKAHFRSKPMPRCSRFAPSAPSTQRTTRTANMTSDQSSLQVKHGSSSSTVTFQSRPSISISCVPVKVTTPSRIGGQVKRPSSSHFVTKTMPLPSHAKSFSRSDRFACKSHQAGSVPSGFAEGHHFVVHISLAGVEESNVRGPYPAPDRPGLELRPRNLICSSSVLM